MQYSGLFLHIVLTIRDFDYIQFVR